MKASVIIPTHNRMSILERVLSVLYEEWKKGSDFEVIVADDASSDGTPGLLQRLVAEKPTFIKTVRLEKNGGPAKARNAALRCARCEIVIIIGDDTLPPHDFVHRHLRWHAQHPDKTAAVLGPVRWPNELNPTPFMCWLQERGTDFYFKYPPVSGDVSLGGTSFYTSNVSLKTDLIMEAGLFDESFPFASHEDLEMGHRLDARGMLLMFDESLKALHWHMLSVEETVQRIYLMGYSAPFYWCKIPDTSSAISRIIKRGACFAARTSITRAFWRWLFRTTKNDAVGRERYWYLLLLLSYWVGLADARGGYEPRDMPAMV